MIPTTCFLKKTKLWTHPGEKENFKEMNFNCFWHHIISKNNGIANVKLLH